jgi:hypothetical protein
MRPTGLLLVALAACGTQAASDQAADGAAPAADVVLAADIAAAVAAQPARTDSILSAHDLTPATLEKLMFRIAADSTMSADYRRLTER